MEKLKMQSHDAIGSNTQKIALLFPNCVTERLGKDGKPELAIDFQKLQAELSNEVITEGEERYQFTWPDKRAAVRLANTPTTMTLRPCRVESVDFDNTQNLYIEGDNLDVLKVLRETYLGKVKMIYIDPPYNTGNDFVYNDDFAQGKDDFEQSSGLFDEEGNQTIDPMQRNTESNGRFHTDWLNMIYPRLKVARDLLSEDGVIFISIDDNEVENLKKICDEVFGHDNFINCIAVKMSEASGVKMNHQKRRFPKIKEYVLFYKKNSFSNFIKIDKYKQENWDRENNIFLEGITKKDREILITIEDKGEYEETDLKEVDKIISKIVKKPLSLAIKEYEVTDKNLTDWLFENSYRIIKTAGSSSLAKLVKSFDEIPNQDIACALSNEGVLFYYITDFNRDTTQPRLQVIFADSNIYKNPCDFWQDIKTTGAIANEGGVLYKNGKKPLQLLNRMITMCTKDNDIVLDFFSGSSSTAHSCILNNQKDGYNRRFIMVQVPENLDNSWKVATGDAKKDIKGLLDFLDGIGKPHYLTEIGKERIRRAGAQIVGTQHGASAGNTSNDLFADAEKKRLDIGFRVLKLDSSNMEDVYYTPQEFELQSLFNENVKADRTNEDLLFQVMLDLGIELSAKIESKQIAGKNVHFVDDNYLVACFDRDVNESTITEIAKLQPIYFVMRDASAANDNVIDNFEQIFKHYSPDTNCRII